MHTSAHLHFKGDCREAFRFYAEVLGGRIGFAMTYGESPGAEQSPPEMRDQIIHARLDLGEQFLLGCDTSPDRYQAPQGFNVMLAVEQAADAERVFRALRHVHRPLLHSLDGQLRQAPRGGVGVRPQKCGLTPPQEIMLALASDLSASDKMHDFLGTPAPCRLPSTLWRARLALRRLRWCHPQP
jgi:PhnB protein